MQCGGGVGGFRSGCPLVSAFGAMTASGVMIHSDLRFHKHFKSVNRLGFVSSGLILLYSDSNVVQQSNALSNL